jgi:hypothetical protein
VSNAIDFNALAEAFTAPQVVEPVDDQAIRAYQRAQLVRRLLQLKFEGIALYRPVTATAERFHACRAKYRLADGSNRSGKTMTACAEMVRAWLGADPYDKYVPRNGNGLIVALDMDHLAILYRKMFCEGAFKIIRDEHTGLWRSVRSDPSNPTRLAPYDEAYREKWRDAPPLVPPRMIQGRIGWEDSAKQVPRVVKFRTGWNVLWRSGNGEPTKSEHYNLVGFDEEMGKPEFFHEACRGIVGLNEPEKHTPRLIWSATSEVNNMELANLRERAATGDASVERFDFLIDDNPFVPERERMEFWNSLTEEQRLTKYKGIPAVSVRAVYPKYNTMLDSESGGHGCEPFEIPKNWTRYFTLDPGRAHTGTVFVAVDPDEQYMTVWDAIDVRNADAGTWAAEVKERECGVVYEAGICDQQMGKETPPGDHNKTVAQQYWEALMRAGVKVRTRGPLNGFFPGSNNVEAREEALRGMMVVRTAGPFAGTPRLRVVRGVSPELDKQIKLAHTDPENPSKRFKHRKQPSDLVECLEYAAAHNPTYHEPELIAEKTINPVLELFRRKQAAKQRNGFQQSIYN